MCYFSVIVPVYNASPWIKECLLSIKNQSFLDFEIIAINDGSSDQSLPLLYEFKEANPHLNFSILTQENKGLGQARNKAVNSASGKWLAFLDADDIWTYNKLELVYNAIQTLNAKWIYHGIFEKNEQGFLRSRNVFKVNRLSEFLEMGNPITPSATVILKKLFLKAQGFDEQRDLVEDLGLWLRLFSIPETPTYLDANLTVYRLDSGVTSNILDHYQKVLKVLDTSVTHKLITEKQKAKFLKRKGYELARFYHKRGEFEKAQNFYSASSGIKSIILGWLAQVKVVM